MSKSSSSNNNNKRNGKRRNRNNNYIESNTTVIPRRMTFPQRILCQETYVDVFNFSSGAAGVPANYLFRLNSTYDPDVTSAGHQPYGRDQLAALYTKYRVLKCIIDIEASNGSANYSSLSVTAMPNSNITFSSTGEGGEQPYGQVHILGYTYPTKIRMNIDLPQLIGQSITTYRGDDSNESIVGASPTAVPVLQLVHQTATGLLGVAVMKVKLVYIVEYFQLESLVAS